MKLNKEIKSNEYNLIKFKKYSCNLFKVYLFKENELIKVIILNLDEILSDLNKNFKFSSDAILSRIFLKDMIIKKGMIYL